jgi:hypothetical protein
MEDGTASMMTPMPNCCHLKKSKQGNERINIIIIIIKMMEIFFGGVFFKSIFEYPVVS